MSNGGVFGFSGGGGQGKSSINQIQIGLYIAGFLIVSSLLKFIGLALPTIVWMYVTRKQKRRKHPLLLKRIVGAEIGLTLLAVISSLGGKYPIGMALNSLADCTTVFGWLNLIGGVIYLYRQRGSQVLRGTELAATPEELQAVLDEKHQKSVAKSNVKVQCRLSIGGIQLPSELENLGIFTFGSPGSGKTQAIARLLSELKQRSDFRVACFDRNGEFTENFYDGSKDLLFNPVDERSVNWSHKIEQARPETIAAGLIPEFSKEPFFNDAARSLLSDLYERCDNNAEIWGVLTTLTTEELKNFVQGGLSHRYFISEKTGGSVLSSLINYVRFYKELPDEGENFSFVKWAREGDSRSLFLPLFEEDSELFKPLYSMVFELILKGLLSNESRQIKTAIIIDELGALNKLNSLARLLSESRKFGGCPILGTQAGAQIRKNYGDEDFDILKQTTKTKLILNCPDPATALIGADLIGKQERLDINYTYSGLLGKSSSSESIRETYAVMPSEIQALPRLEGYLLIADGTRPAKVCVTPKSYPLTAKRLIPRTK